MRTSQRIGGIAALIAAVTNLVGAVVYATLLVPKGFGSENPDPGRIVALLAGNQRVYQVWLLVIWLAFGVCLIFLSVALHERLKAASAVPAQTAAVFTLAWAVLAGILHVFMAVDGLLVVNAVGLVIWFAWLGIVMLRRSPSGAVQRLEECAVAPAASSVIDS